MTAVQSKATSEFADPIDMILLCASLYWAYAGEYIRLAMVGGLLLLKVSAQKPLAGNDYKEATTDAESLSYLRRLLDPAVEEAVEEAVEAPAEEAHAATTEIVQELHAEEPCDPEEDVCGVEMLKAPSQTPQLASIDVSFERSKSISARREAIKRMRARAFRLHYQGLARTSQPAGYSLSRGASSDTLASPNHDLSREKAKEFMDEFSDATPKSVKGASRKRRSVLGWLQSQNPVMEIAVDTIKKTVPSLMERYLELATVAALLDLPHKQRKPRLSATLKQTLAQAHDLANWENDM